MTPIEQTFKTSGGTELFYRAWVPDRPVSKAVILFHRGHEHSGRWQQTVEALKLNDFAVFAWDQRGHGRSPGERGSADNLATIIKDADVFARHISKTYGIAPENTAILGHSVGAVIAAAWVHDYAPRIRALILATPAFRVKLYVPLAIPLLRLKQKTIGAGTIKSYVKSNLLTHDQAEADAYNQDPLIFRQIAVNILLDLQDTSTRLLADAGTINVPTLMLAAKKDWIVKLSAQREFFTKISSPLKQFEVLDGFCHAIFHEADRRVVVNRIRSFILEAFDRQPHHDSLLESDRGGFTRTEYDLLRSPRDLRWPVMQRVLKTGGRLSRGISLGWKTGFDSGMTLDYVYENRSRGTTPLGRVIDRFYLNSPGWRGIRVRRENLQRALRECMNELHADGRSVRILDIASGPGRYVLETIKAMPDVQASAVLRDYREENLEAGKRMAEAMGIGSATFTLGDAFDRESLAQISPQPTIAIASGIYELFPENDRVLRSLQGVADCINEGGYLIYTNQPWHPQLEFIARVLTNREGKPWVMRRRSQAEMDALVCEAGFEKLDQRIDQWGIFTVSIARRVAR